MKNRRFHLLLGLSVLLASTLACMINVGGPAYPSDRIPVSTEAVTQVQDIISTADAQAFQTGQVDISLNEPQVTSYLVYQMQQNPQAIFTDPQVYLQDGQIQIYGKASQTYFTGTVRIDVALGVDDQGGLTVDITSADFGPLPVPAGLRTMVTNAIRQAYGSALGQAANHFQLEKVSIADGVLHLSGKVK